MGRRFLVLFASKRLCDLASEKYRAMFSGRDFLAIGLSCVTLPKSDSVAQSIAHSSGGGASN
jgi:hypothetical protein